MLRAPSYKLMRMIFGCLAIVFWFSSIWLWMNLDAHSSGSARPGQNYVHPLNTHGHVVYISDRQSFMLHGLMILGALFFILASLTYVFELISSKRAK